MNTTSLKRALKNPLLFGLKAVEILGPMLSDKTYLKWMFRLKMGKKLNLDAPKTYNEKLQWIKLYDRNPEYTTMVDKFAVKKFVSDKIGEEYVVPNYGVWDTPEQIDFDALPNSFVLKTNQGGGSQGLYFCKNKSELDKAAAIEEMRRGLKMSIYKHFREWPYKNVKPRIIAEEYLSPKSQNGIDDYKILCFDGKAEYIEYHTDRFSDHHKQYWLTCDWKLADISQSDYSEVGKDLCQKPDCLEEMLRLSEVLAKDIPHIRVDWYNNDGKLYFGELTFFDGSGFEKFDDISMDLKLGELIDLKQVRVQ